jgi:hypothetical protein
LVKDEKTGMLKTLFLQPFGMGWDAVFSFINEFKDDLSSTVNTHVVEVINEWSGLINVFDDLPASSRKVGLISLWLLDSVKDSYQREGQRKKILSALLKVSSAIGEEFNSLMNEDVFISKRSPRRFGYVDQLVSLALTGTDVAMLCKRNPDFIIKLALHEWLLEEPDQDEFGYRNFGGIGVDEYFGLDSERDFFPASGAKGPFKYLLQSDPRLGLDFIVKLCNISALKYSESSFAAAKDNEEETIYPYETVSKKVVISLNDGSNVTQFCSPHLWKGYRGHSTLPYLLQCALMALENWLIDYLEKYGDNNQVNWIFDYILRSSNSVMPTSVLASVATGFPEKVGKASYPLLTTSEFYYLDLVRTTAEMGENELHFFGFNRDMMSKMYIEERREAALRPWRKESLETLLTRLQLNNEHRDATLQILDKLIKHANSSNDKSLRYMVHRVDTRTWEAIEDKENKRVLLQSSSELPEDLKQDQKEFNEKRRADDKATKLNLWSRKLIEDEVFESDYYTSYSDALSAARELLDSLHKNEIENFADMAIGTIAKVAAVCIRDSIESLNEEEQEWCFDIILESSVLGAEDLDGTTSHDVTDFYGSGVCAFVLPKLFDLELTSEQCLDIKHAMAMALTHENIEVGRYLAQGIREFLWTRDAELASYFVFGSVEYAKFRRDNSEHRRFHYLQNGELRSALENWQSLIKSFRESLISGDSKCPKGDICFKSHSSWFYHLPFLMIPLGSTEDDHIRLINNIVKLTYENEYQDHRKGDDERIHHDVVKHIKDCLTEHIVYSRNDGFLPFKNLFLEGCSKAPSFIYSVVLSFNIAVEKEENYEATWPLWLLLKPEVLKIALNNINEDYRRRDNDLNMFLRGMMYADTPWQGHENEERDMKTGSPHLLQLAEQSASNSHVFEALASLIYNFHKVFFDEGIKILAQHFSQNSELIAKQPNTSFYLEMAIGRYLQNDNRGTLSRKMYEVCLSLLDGVVETGSARAYYLREQIIRSRKIK